MKRCIFRGKRLEDGEIVTGHGVYFDPPQKAEGWTYIIRDEFPLVSKNWQRVDPNSVEMIEDDENETA